MWRVGTFEMGSEALNDIKQLEDIFGLADKLKQAVHKHVDTLNSGSTAEAE